MTDGRISPDRISALSLDEHREAIVAATDDFSQNPYALVRHYVHAAFKRYGSISEAARVMNVPRRTVQRILAKRLS